MEARIGITIEDDNPIMEWIIAHVAFLWSRCRVGHDGMTPIERLIGRKWVQPMTEVGGVVLAKLTLGKIAKGNRKP